MKNKILPIFLSVFFLIIFFIFYKGLQTPNIYVPKTDIQKRIPIFEAEILDAVNKISSEDIFKENKFYLLNIWASWCLPCRDEHSLLISLNNQKDINIIGLNYKDNYENAKKFLKELGSPYKKILLDKDGTIAIELGAYGVPETFLIYNKKIIKKIIGPLDKNSVMEIKELIK